MTANQFDQETAVNATGPGSWSTTISSAWNIGENPNGGYLLSPLLRALGAESPHPDPVSVTTHFLRPGIGDAPAELTSELLRTGRTFSTLRGSLTQGAKVRLQMLATFGDLSAGAAEHDFAPSPPDMPAPEDCPLRSGAHQEIDLPIMSRVEARLPEEYLERGTRATAELAGWIRFRDERPSDTRSVLLFADAFPPAVFTRLGRVGWVPTIELTVHVRRRPQPGWLQGSFTCGDLAGSQLIEDGKLWDSSGQLVAQSRQLAFLREEQPPATP